MVTKRQEQILNLIVSLYAKDHAPVGSKALLEMVQASSATIRNDMKALEKLGYLQKEHSSSGRVPSASGYQYYVEHGLSIEEFSQNDLFQVMKAFDKEFYRLSDIFELAANVTSDLTGLTAFVLNVPQSEQSLASFETVMLDSHSMLAVSRLSSGEVRSAQFNLPRSMTEKDLEVFVEMVNERLVGKSLLDVHYRLRTEIPQVVQRYFKVTEDVLKLIDHIFAELFVEKLTIAGRSKIFDYSSDNPAELYKLFSDDQRMLHEIREVTAAEELRSVRFDGAGQLQHLSLISQKFVIPYRGLGTIALAGPIDLDYQRILSVLDLVAKVLSMKLADYYRYLDGNHYEIRT